jgi:hypothetical protein
MSVGVMKDYKVKLCEEVTTDCRKRVAPKFSLFHIFPFLPEVFVPGTSRVVQTNGRPKNKGDHDQMDTVPDGSSPPLVTSLQS